MQALPDCAGEHGIRKTASLCQDELKHGALLRKWLCMNPEPPHPSVPALDGAGRGVDPTAGLVSIAGEAGPIASWLIWGFGQ